MNNLEFRNIEQVYLNGNKVTLAEIWEERYNHETNDNYFVFQGRAEIKGHFKRASTFAKKFHEQNQF